MNQYPWNIPKPLNTNDMIPILSVIAVVLFACIMFFVMSHITQKKTVEEEFAEASELNFSHPGTQDYSFHDGFMDSPNTRSSQIQVFHEIAEAASYLKQSGIRKIMLGKITFQIKTIFWGEWSESEKNTINDLFNREELWSQNLNTEFTKDFGQISVDVIASNESQSDAILSGPIFVSFIAKRKDYGILSKFLSRDHGSLIGASYLELHTIPDHKLIAYFQINEKEKIQ